MNIERLPPTFTYSLEGKENTSKKKWYAFICDTRKAIQDWNGTFESPILQHSNNDPDITIHLASLRQILLYAESNIRELDSENICEGCIQEEIDDLSEAMPPGLATLTTEGKTRAYIASHLYSWWMADMFKADIRSAIIAHEVGHCLGLDHQEDLNIESIMHPSISLKKTPPTVSTDDKERLIQTTSRHGKKGLWNLREAWLQEE